MENVFLAEIKNLLYVNINFLTKKATLNNHNKSETKLWNILYAKLFIPRACYRRCICFALESQVEQTFPYPAQKQHRNLTLSVCSIQRRNI